MCCSLLQDECSDNELIDEVPCTSLAGSSALADGGLVGGSKIHLSSSSTRNSTDLLTKSTSGRQLPVNTDLSPRYSAYSSDEDDHWLGGVESTYTLHATSSYQLTKPSSVFNEPDHPTCSTFVSSSDSNQNEVEQDTDVDSSDESSYVSSDTIHYSTPRIKKSSPLGQHCLSSGDELAVTKKVKSEVIPRSVASPSHLKRKAFAGTSLLDLYDGDDDYLPGDLFSRQTKRPRRPGHSTPAVKFAIADWMGKYQYCLLLLPQSG
jgi:hypothetical protein